MTLFKKILPVSLLALALLSACVKADVELPDNGDGNIPEGYAQVNFNLVTANSQVFATRAGDPMITIDDVHLLIFETTEVEGLTDASPLILRNYYQYGVMQHIYLRKGDDVVYYVYVIANLDDSNCPNSTVETFFTGVENYGQLKEKYVQFLERTPQQLGKVVMSTGEAIRIALPSNSDVFSPTIPLQRMQAKFTINIYNRVTSSTDATVLSKVYPTTLAMVDLPRYSYVMSREVNEVDYPDGTHDYPFTLSPVSDGYYTTTANFLPASTGIVGHNGNWYSKQTIEFFAFENRRGSEPDINDYGASHDNVPNVYGRKLLAPEFSSHLRLTSLTEGNTLLTYVHAGKVRADGATALDITNFDVDRNSIYHFDIYINSANDVSVDTRRELLNLPITFTLPDVRRIDAHYVDIPSFIQGTLAGMAKMQSGKCNVDAAGDIIYDGGLPSGWSPMLDSEADSLRWLRFSWVNPYTPTRPINTSLYVGMNSGVDGITGATPILHFNEYVDDVQQATIPAVNPSRRSAAIRIGFVAEATSAAEYEQGVLDGLEVAFFVPVSQYGLKTIGQMGGYLNGAYTKMLGVESVEEYTLRYYDRDGFPNQDEVNDGPYWRYTNRFVNHNQKYDGWTATRDHYTEYRAGGVPPKRGEAITYPTAGTYNPYSNTNAADYCVRKNRDENGNGIIDDDELKWYLPTPVQMMQMYIWRDAFRNGSYTLNLDYIPFGSRRNDGTYVSRYYWTTNEEDAAGYQNAYAVDFVQGAAAVTSIPKSDRNPVRCVRDIPGTVSSIFTVTDGHLVVDLTDNFPDLDTSKPGKGSNSDLNLPENNTLAKKFLLSRWYATQGNNHGLSPVMVEGNKSPNCDSYSEPGYSGNWVLPSQLELSFLYAYAGMLEDVLETAYPGTPNTAATYHTFRTEAPSPHWAITDIGNGSSFWNVDFATGAARTLSKSGNKAYFRCVYYIP